VTEPEVDERRTSKRIYHHIRALEILVTDVELMERVNSQAQSPKEADDALMRPWRQNLSCRVRVQSGEYEPDCQHRTEYAGGRREDDSRPAIFLNDPFQLHYSW
jgi:hypothetical protein